ncbi:tetratricopeptide repeat protein [Erythrobacter neustonensis]|nr:tetratricopeptide repeat protein [Erythrobacter neustonensis]
MAQQDTHSSPGSSRIGWGLLAGALMLAAGAAAFHLTRGPGDPPPFADAGAGADAGGAASIEQLRTRAEASPTDPAPWRELAMAQFGQRQYADAAAAYRRAIEIMPGDASLWSALGETLVLSSASDPLPADALAAFRQAVSIDPKDPRARYFLAARRDLDKDHEGAVADWLALLADSPAGAPWEADLVRTIEQVGQMHAIPVAPRIAAAQAARPAAMIAGGQAGPGAADVAAASNMTAAQQRAMIDGMVAQLEQKLRQNPQDPAGWSMLVRSRMMLGDAAGARAALDAGIAANPQAAAQLRSDAATLGLR